MQGRRIYPADDGRLHLFEGDYGWDLHIKCWVIRPLGCHAGGIPHHEVTEHPDGTITVSPSIVLYDTDEDGNTIEVFHGYLERGVWRGTLEN